MKVYEDWDVASILCWDCSHPVPEARLCPLCIEPICSDCAEEHRTQHDEGGPPE